MCTNLIYLNLSQNQITSIQGLNNLSNLNILDLSMNLIEKIENLDGLADLEQLLLYGNRIRIIENLDGISNLKILKINNNRLLSINELALYDLHSLEVLNAANNIIDLDELENCIKTIMTLVNLREVSLYGNLVTDDPTYKFRFSDHTNLSKLDGLELKPAIKQKFQDMKKDYEIDKLVEFTKEEYFNRIEAEREIKMAAVNMLKKQHQKIADQYDNFIEYMEKDFDGFINYVYELKKNKDLGKNNEINDIDLYQWRKTLQDKEQERLKLLEDALNGIQIKEQYMITPQVLNLNKEGVYKTTMPPPQILENLSNTPGATPLKTQNAVKNYSAIQNNKTNTAFTPYEENKMDEVLKQYDKFKNEYEGYQGNQKQIRDDPIYQDRSKKPQPPEMPLLRDPKIRDLYGPLQTPKQENPGNEDSKEIEGGYPRGSSEAKEVPQINLNDLRPQTKKSEGEDSNRSGKKKGKKKKKDKNDKSGDAQPNQDSSQPPPKKKSKGCVIF